MATDLGRATWNKGMEPELTTAIDSLKFVTWKVALHADMMQYQVTTCEEIERSMRTDEKTIRQLEEKLSEAAKASERIAVMSKALSGARNTARVHQAHVTKPSTNFPASDAVTKTSSIADILKFSKAAEVFDGESDALRSIVNAVDESQAALFRFQEELRRTKKMSVRRKLEDLEAKKSACRDVYVDDVIHQQFACFEFSPSAEAILFRNPKFTDGINGANTVVGKKAHARGSVPTPSHSRVNDQNIELFLKQASRRLTMRYTDALEALQMFAPSSSDSDMRLLYAVDFASRLTASHNFDVALNDFIFSSPESILASEYEALCNTWTASGLAQPNEAPLLQPDAFHFLPVEWQGVEQELGLSCSGGSGHGSGSTHQHEKLVLDILEACKSKRGQGNVHPDDKLGSDAAPLLPPAKHILTCRYSYADVEEMKRTDRLRVEVQRSLLALAFDKALGSAREASDRGGGDIGWSRMGEESAWTSMTSGKRCVWPTVAATVVDPDGRSQ